MRYCVNCKKPMYTSNNSIWIKDVNYEVHKECEEEFKSKYGSEVSENASS